MRGTFSKHLTKRYPPHDICIATQVINIASEMSSKKVAVILGYGLAVADVATQRLVELNYSVALVARNESRLREAEAKYGSSVTGFPFDLSQSDKVPELLNDIASKLGPIDVLLYNSTTLGGGDPYIKSPAEIAAGINVNIVSLHTAFATLLPLWKERGSGTLVLTGGGFAENGAWSIGVGMQFGAPTKAYFKNFAQVIFFI